MRIFCFHDPGWPDGFLAMFVCLFLIGPFISGCSQHNSKQQETYLARVGHRVVSQDEFNQALDFAEVAYPHNSLQNKDILESVKWRVLNQLIEEAVILNKADEKHIVVTDIELDRAVAKIKEDYPGKTFEEAFLENAISFDSWKKSLRRRLLTEKVLKSELESKIPISKDDIARYLSEHSTGYSVDDSADVDKMIVNNIRREKAEKQFNAWMKSLRKEYPVTINKPLWRKIIKMAP